MEIRLSHVQDEDSWKAYHFIRRRVLYEMRGRYDYDETHPDEYRKGHFPLLFSFNGMPVGTARLDLPNTGTTVGTVRLVAVLPPFQRQGVGKAMMHEIETFAAIKGARQLEVHAAHDAVAFYEKLGWSTVDATRRNPLLMKMIL